MMKCIELAVILILMQSLACHGQDKIDATAGSGSQTQATTDQVSTYAEGDPKADPAGRSPGSYKIGPGDILIITVWKETTLSGSYLVRPDGMISVPLLGDVQSSLLTPSELARDLENRLERFIQNPNVTVQISQVHSKVIYLLGEVMKKGPIDMAAGMTLLQAISSAGGLTEYANSKKAYILRNESGKQVKILVHYKEALKGDSSFNLVLQPGDTIVVP